MVFIMDLAKNRKARYDYEILETFDAGMKLLGTEIKSLRSHGGSIQEAYVSFKKEELFLVGSHIAPYAHGNIHNHPERRDRKLLLHKSELATLKKAVEQKGLTIVPLAIFLSHGLAKLKIALARGKKKHDKRATIKQREEDRAIARKYK